MKKGQYINGLLEFIGTFSLVFFGCLIAIISNGNIIYIALTFGVVVFIFISIFGNKYDINLNPAVSLAMYCSGKLKIFDFLRYIVLQLIGSFTAIVLLKFIVTENIELATNNLVLTNMNYSLIVLITFVTEAFLTTLLVLIILKVSKDKHSKYIKAILISSSLIVLFIIGFNLSGSSFNPARSIAPAILINMNSLKVLWIYILGPLTGSILGVLMYKISFKVNLT